MTLNQVVKRLQTLALNHKQVHHFYCGDMVEWLANGDIDYPAIFVDFQTGSISGDEKQAGFDFEIWFCDLVDTASNSRENELEVFSDLTSIAMDYKAMLEYTEYRDWDIEPASSLKYYKEEFEDITCAVQMSVRISVRYDSNRCSIPTNIDFEDNTDQIEVMTLVNMFEYIGEGAEGNTLTVTALKPRVFLEVIKGDKILLRELDEDAELRSDQYRFNTSTGVLEFGNDIEFEQVVRVLNR